VKVETTPIAGVLLITPRVFSDPRGSFLETWQAERYAEAGVPSRFVQDNLSRSVQGTLRGLHYQVEKPQGKLVQVVRGACFDVAVDLRRSSPSFGRWFGAVLSDENRAQLWVPEGCAHGFLALSEQCDFAYKVTAPYYAAGDRSLAWDDPTVGIAWPLEGRAPLLSAKDAAAPRWADAEMFA
jgi:dTDP-4-dehydrorhamnose 3,5-epimerase